MINKDFYVRDDRSAGHFRSIRLRSPYVTRRTLQQPIGLLHLTNQNSDPV